MAGRASSVSRRHGPDSDEVGFRMFAHIHRLVVSRFRRGAPVHLHAMTAGADGCGFEHQEKVEQDDEESEHHQNEHHLRGNFPHHVGDRPAKNENNANHTEGAKPPLETFPSGLVFAIARETCRIQPGEIENFPHGAGRMGYCVLRRQHLILSPEPMQHPVRRTWIQSRAETEAAHVKEQRRGKTQRVDAIHETTVARNRRTPVLGTEVAFDGRHHQAAEESRHADQQRHQGRLPRAKRSRPIETGADQYRCPDAPQGSLPGLAGTHMRGHLASTTGLPPGVLQDIAHLHGEHEEEQQLCVLTFVALERQGQDHRHVTHGVHAHQQRPLDFCGAGQKVFRLPRQHPTEWNENKGIHGNENGKQSVPVDSHQEIMQRQNHKERPEQHRVVRALRAIQRDEFPHRQKRKRSEQHRCEHRPQQDRQAEHHRHDPPRFDARIEIRHGRPRSFGRHPRGTDGADDRSHDQNAKHRAEEINKFGIHGGNR